jgi:hypothetical protein
MEERKITVINGRAVRQREDGRGFAKDDESE